MCSQTLLRLALLYLWTVQGAEIYETPTIEKINLGYVLKPIHSFQVSNAVASMLFSFELPDSTPSTFQNLTRDCNRMTKADSQASALCATYMEAYANMIDMKKQAQDNIGHVVNLAYELTDTLQNDTRTKREYPSWLSKIFGSITGLATQNQMDALQVALRKMQNNVGQAVNAFEINQDHIATSVKLQTKRLDAIQNFSTHVQNEVDTLAHMVATSQFQQNTINKLHLQMAKMLFKLTLITSDINTLYEALQRLFSGNISPHLLSHTTLEETLNTISDYLAKNQPHLQIVHRNPLHYYRTNEFLLFRRENHVFLQLECPLSSLADKFVIYKFEKIPLITPGSPGYYSVLDTPLMALAVASTHYLTFYEESEIVSVPQVLNLNRSPLTLRRINFPSCEMAIWQGNVDKLHELCSYHVVKGDLPAQIIRLSSTSIYVSNITKLVIECDDTTVDKTNEIKGKQLVMNIPCACEVTANQFWIPRRVKSCNDTNGNFTSHSLHTINYMYLRQFLTEDFERISPDVLYKDFPNISLPGLKTDQLTYKALIALSDEARFDLLRVVNATKNDKKTFHTVGDMAMQQLLGETETFGMTDITSTILSAIVVGLTVAVIYLFFKLKTLTTLMIVTQRGYGIQAMEVQNGLALKYEIPVVSTPSPYTLLDLKNDFVSILPLELGCFLQ